MGHILNGREGQIETIHVVLSENTHAQLRVHTNKPNLWHQFPLEEVNQCRLISENVKFDQMKAFIYRKLIQIEWRT